MVTARLRLLHTTDLHMHLLAHDYFTDRPDPTLGLERLATLIRRLRAEEVPSLLFDTGDFLQGNPLADQAIADASPHPIASAFATLGYDALTLGNHDFDYGLPALMRAIDGLPVVCANARIAPRETLVPPWRMLECPLAVSDGGFDTLRVGVIGFVTPAIAGGAEESEPLRVGDVLDTARTWLPRVRREGADIIVALCHGGIDTGRAHPKMEHPALHLAALPGVDVVLAGHSHDVFPGTSFAAEAGIDPARGLLHGKPATLPGAYGSHLGQIDLSLILEEDRWRVAGSRCRLHAARDQPPGAPIAPRPLQVAHDRVRAALSRSIATTPRRLTSHFAVLGRDDGAALLAEACIAAAGEALSGTPWSDLPVLAATAPFRAGGKRGPQNFLDIAPGPVTMRDVAAISPFDDPVRIVLRRGWQLRDWLEAVAALFAAPSRDAPPLLPRDRPAYLLDTLHGLRYRIDLSRPPRSGGSGPGRLRDLTHQGARVEDDALFAVAMSSYRAQGGGRLFFPDPDDLVARTEAGMTSVLAEHLSAHGIPNAGPDPNWRLMASAGGSVRLRVPQTAWPDALPPGPAITAGAPDADGALTLTLDFGSPRGLA